MKIPYKLLSTGFALAVTFGVNSPAGFAQGRHPAYLHALTDLRSARAHLEKALNNPAGAGVEGKAIGEIDAAIGEIKKAGIDDGKDLNDHPPVDAKLDVPGLRHHARELLDKAHSDIAQEEDNKFAQGLQQRAFGHIDKAHHFVDDALKDTKK